MRSRYWVALLVLGCATALAHGENCKFRADRAAGVDAKGVEKVVVRAGAGELKVVGLKNAVRIEARGVACADAQKLLDASQISARREGNIVYIETQLPQDDQNFSWGGNDDASIDLGVALPANLPVEATDSSGDAVFEDLNALKLEDSSGELTIRRIAGALDVNDSSGDLVVTGAGSVRANDSSGDIEIAEVRGDVEIPSDSSGEIQIRHVGGSVNIDSDSSGGIRVEEVKGSVRIGSDSSGDIYAGRVGGDFTVEADSSGSIEHESIGGRVSVPSDHRE
jgi:DUF4097 and DUF4098 domain-containing protein YvlB